MLVFCWYDPVNGKHLHIITKENDPDNHLLTSLSPPTDSIWMIPGTVEA